MHFEIKDTELDLINKVALEDELSLDGALKKLLFLGRDFKRNEDTDVQIQTSLLEKLMKRTESLNQVASNLQQEAEEVCEEIRDLF